MPSVNVTVTVSAAPGAGDPLSLRLDFADGTQLSFHEDQATDLGTVDTGLMQQRCLRQICAEQGTYRGAFHVDFRTDQRGKKTVIVEYGTRYLFPPGQPPKTDNNVVPQHLFLPPRAVVSKTAGGTSQQAGQARASVSYVGPDGENLAPASDADGIALAAGDRLVVKSPPAFEKMTGYKVYARLIAPAGGSDARYLQTPNPIALGQDWICPADGLKLTGALPPTKPAVPAYTVTVSGGPLANPVVVPVEFQVWRTRFAVWTESEQPVQRTYQQLVDMKAILPMSLKHVPGLAMPDPVVWKGPLDNAGLQTQMGLVGERPELGLHTSVQVAYLMTGAAVHLTSMMAQASAAGSFPFWVRDAGKPGAPIVDLDVHPFLAFNDANNGPHRIPTPDTYALNYARAFFGLDESHLPSVSYVPYMLTGDPGHLEGMQAAALYGVIENNFTRLNQKPPLPKLADQAQPRACAWAWRDIFRAASYTPDVVPSWITPKNAFATMVPDQVAYGQKFLDNKSSPCTTVFKFFQITSETTAFMLDYQCHAVAEIKRRGGFPEMNGIFDYIVTPRIAMCDVTGKSGYDHRYPMLYYKPVIDARKRASAVGAPASYYTVAPNPDTPESFAEWFSCINDLALAQKWAGWTDPTKLAPNRVSPHQSGYYTLIRSSLAVLSQAGYDTRASHDWLEDQLLVKKWPDVAVWMYLHWTFDPASAG